MWRIQARESEVRMSEARKTDDSLIRNSCFPLPSDFGFLDFGFPPVNACMFLQHRIQHAVDERRAVARSRTLRQLDRFVDDDLWRRVGVGQFPDGQAEDVAIDARLPARRPLRGELFQPPVGQLAVSPRINGGLGGALRVTGSSDASCVTCMRHVAVERPCAIEREKQLKHRKLANSPLR